jgi:hypothetical protein
VTVLPWVLLAVAVVAAAAGWLLVVARTRSVVRRRLRERLLVTMKSGAAFDGLLYEADARHWVLREASALGAADQGENVLLDGEVVLATAEIDYCQRP